MIFTFHSVFPMNNIKETLDPMFVKNRLAQTIVASYIIVHLLLLSRFADKCIVLSKPCEKTLVSEYKIEKAKILCVPHGVPSISLRRDVKAFREKYQIDDKKVVSLVGWGHRTKGFHYLIRALPLILRSVPDVVTFITSGIRSADERKRESYLEFLEKEVERVGVKDHVRITGYLSDTELEALLSITDLFVFPYEYRVNASGAANMSLIARKPLVVSDIPLFEDLVAEGLAIPVDPKDKEALAGAVARCLTDNILRSNVAERIEDYARRNSMENIAGKHYALYRELMSK